MQSLITSLKKSSLETTDLNFIQNLFSGTTALVFAKFLVAHNPLSTSVPIVLAPIGMQVLVMARLLQPSLFLLGVIPKG